MKKIFALFFLFSCNSQPNPDIRDQYVGSYSGLISGYGQTFSETWTFSKNNTTNGLLFVRQKQNSSNQGSATVNNGQITINSFYESAQINDTTENIQIIGTGNISHSELDLILSYRASRANKILLYTLSGTLFR